MIHMICQLNFVSTPVIEASFLIFMAILPENCDVYSTVKLTGWIHKALICEDLVLYNSMIPLGERYVISNLIVQQLANHLLLISYF